MTKIEYDYIIKNDEKGYFGLFSKEGKNSAEILTNIRMKDILLNPQHNEKNKKEAMINFLKRNGYHNIYGDDKKVDPNDVDELKDSIIEEIEEDIDIFKKGEQLQNKSENKNKKKSKNKKLKVFHRLNPKLYKYYDMHMKKKKSNINNYQASDIIQYDANKDYVMKRILISPKWEKMTGRKPLFRTDNTKYYLSHEEPLKNIGHNFIDMNKQTMRGNFTNIRDPRIITTRTFRPKNRNKRSNKKIITNKNNISIADSEYFSLDKNNVNLYMNYEKNFVKSDKKKRIKSAITASTSRPQTAMQKNLTTLTSNNSKHINTSNSLIGNRNITSISNINNLNILNENNISLESLSESNDSYNIYKSYYKRQIKPKENNNKITNMKKIIKGKKRPKSSYIKRKLNINENNKSNKVNKTNIKGPDFNKTISREDYYNLLDKGSVIPFSLPNFKQVRERPLTMVVYERPKYKKYTKKEITAITPDMYSDIYKYLDNVNNHKRCVTPNFNKMNINYKKNDKSPLPIYMRGITSRDSCNIMNETSLKMNHFFEGKFLSNYSSFWPKKSFNKIVNLNLLNSEAFLSHLLNKEGEKDYMKKSIKFYQNNYKDLLKEGYLNKFDSVTFKTIKPKINLKLNFEQIFQKLKEKKS